MTQKIEKVTLRKELANGEVIYRKVPKTDWIQALKYNNTAGMKEVRNEESEQYIASVPTEVKSLLNENKTETKELANFEISKIDDIVKLREILDSRKIPYKKTFGAKKLKELLQ